MSEMGGGMIELALLSFFVLCIIFFVVIIYLLANWISSLKKKDEPQKRTADQCEDSGRH
jgi:uncharacterized membrane protein